MPAFNSYNEALGLYAAKQLQAYKEITTHLLIYCYYRTYTGVAISPSLSKYTLPKKDHARMKNSTSKNNKGDLLLILNWNCLLYFNLISKTSSNNNFSDSENSAFIMNLLLTLEILSNGLK